MALQAVKGGVPFPVWPGNVSGAPSTTNVFTLDASGEKGAYVFAATAAKDIHKIHFRTATVTTGDTMDVRVETVDDAANGDPTGTLWATNTNAAVVIANGDDNVWKTATLTADATVAIGDKVAIVVVNGAAGVMNLSGYADQGAIAMLPYGDLFAAAAWAKTAIQPLFVAEYSDGSFEPVFGYLDAAAVTANGTFASDATTNRRGNIFQLAFPCRAKGCWVWVDADGAFTVKVYDSDGSSVLATTATVSPFQRTSNAAGVFFLPFTTTATLAAATNYRMAIVPTTTTNLIAYDFDVPAAGMLDMFPGGQSCHRSVFTSSAWVETTTARTYMGLILDAFDDGAGSGGMAVNQGLHGIEAGINA